MTEPVKVFFEPKIALHDPALYASDRTAVPIDAAQAGSDRALGAYRDHGYLLVRGLLAPDLVTAGRAELEAMALAEDPACEQIWYEGALRDRLSLDPARDREIDGRREGVGFVPGQEGDGLPALQPTERARYVRKLAGFVTRHPPLGALAGHHGLVALVRRLLGGRPPVLFQDMALVKPAGGREKPWHQDHAYFNVALDTPIVGVWIPFGAVTPENGCMHVIEGGHRTGPQPHRKQRDWQICDGDVETAGRVAVPMRAGDVLLFDGKLPHGTPVNRTDSFRWAVQFHYRPASAHEIADAERLAAFGAEGKDVSC
jgi:phytanoyl-CoA hydroxylase